MFKEEIAKILGRDDSTFADVVEGVELNRLAVFRVNNLGDGIDSERDILIDSTDPDLVYVGEAPIGTLESAESWRIKGLIVDGAIKKTKYADGSAAFDKEWDERATYSY